MGRVRMVSSSAIRADAGVPQSVIAFKGIAALIIRSIPILTPTYVQIIVR